MADMPSTDDEMKDYVDETMKKINKILEEAAEVAKMFEMGKQIDSILSKGTGSCL